MLFSPVIIIYFVIAALWALTLFSWSEMAYLCSIVPLSNRTSDSLTKVQVQIMKRWYLLCDLHYSFDGFQHICCFLLLTHWGRMTHKCASKIFIIGSDNGFSPSRRQAIIWTNVWILLIGPLGIYLNEISIEINTCSFEKMHLKMYSAKWGLFRPGLSVLKRQVDFSRPVPRGRWCSDRKVIKCLLRCFLSVTSLCRCVIGLLGWLLVHIYDYITLSHNYGFNSINNTLVRRLSRFIKLQYHRSLAIYVVLLCFEIPW